MMSVPIATWTVTGIWRRCAVAIRLRSAHRAFADGEVGAHGLTKPLLPGLRAANDLVEDSARLFGHAKAPGSQRFVHILRCDACKRDLEIVDDASAVHCKRGHVSALHQVDDDWRDTGLDHMGADAPNDAGIARACIDDGTHDATKVLSGENGWQRVKPFFERAPLRTRPGEVLGARLTLPGGEGVCPNAGKIELLVAEWHAQYGSSWHNLSPHKELERRPIVRLAVAD